jgi:Erv1 / Alr family
MKHNKTQKKLDSFYSQFTKNFKQNGGVYSEADYNSNDGMLTTVWGPSMWHYLHTMSFNYPVHPTDENKKHYREFILNLENVLPCGKCRKNLKKNFKKLPLKESDMENRETFSRYIYNLHELINKMLKKKSGLSYEDVRERYEHFRSRCVKPIKTLKKRKQCTKKQKHVHFAKKISILSEKGCTEPLYGEKSKCILKIVPQEKKCESFQMDDNCIKKRESDV